MILNMVWLFQFQPEHMPRSINLLYQVYTPKEDLMKAFLLQHKFNDGFKYVKYVDLDKEKEVDVDGIEELCVYKIGSNKLHKVVNLVTSEHFMEKATLEVCSKISQVSYLGNMLQYDLAVIDDVKEQINNLPAGNILDVGTDEYDSLNIVPRDPREQLYSTLDEWAERCAPDDEGGLYEENDRYIYDVICEEFTLAAAYKTPLPITLEAYTEYFVGLLTDEYT